MPGLDTLRSAKDAKLTPQACLAACEELVHGELFQETEALLALVGGSGEANGKIARINDVRDVVRKIAAQLKVTDEQVQDRLGSVEHLYVVLKTAEREKRGIAKEDPAYDAIRNVVAVCARLHARTLALIEMLRPLATSKPASQKPLVKAKPLQDRDTSDDLGNAIGPNDDLGLDIKE